MTQPQIDRLFDRIRDICLALPEAKEVVAWGHPTFRAPKKMFAGCGTDKDGSVSLGLKVGFDRQDELLKDPRFFPTPYAARQGWVSLRLRPRMDWVELTALVIEAYRQVAPKRRHGCADDPADGLNHLPSEGEGTRITGILDGPGPEEAD